MAAALRVAAFCVSPSTPLHYALKKPVTRLLGIYMKMLINRGVSVYGLSFSYTYATVRVCIFDC